MQTKVPGNTMADNEVFKIIYKRRAVRKYKNRKLDPESIEAIVDAGRMAPSAINRQPWRFYVIDKKEDIALLEKEVLRASAKGILKSRFKNVVKSAWVSMWKERRGIQN